MGTSTPTSAKDARQATQLRPQEIIRRLRDLFDVPVRQGAAAGLWGVFKPKARIVRTKIDSDVLPKLKDFAEIRYINVNGHSDLLGSPTYNQALSEKRAAAVRDYLVAQGVSGDKIEVYGFGKTLPIKSCRGEKGRRALIECLAPNRRVQIEVQGTLRQ